MLYAQPMDIRLIFRIPITFLCSDKENNLLSFNGYSFNHAQNRILGKSGILSLMRIFALGMDPVERLGNRGEESFKKNCYD